MIPESKMKDFTEKKYFGKYLHEWAALSAEKYKKNYYSKESKPPTDVVNQSKSTTNLTNNN